MKAIMQRAWREPAVCIGLLASLILLVLQLVGDDKFTADTVISICAPLVAALGIRQTVSPALELGGGKVVVEPVAAAPPTTSETPPT